MAAASRAALTEELHLPLTDGQSRFAHLFRPENEPLVERIQAQVDVDWAELAERCAERTRVAT